MAPCAIKTLTSCSLSGHGRRLTNIASAMWHQACVTPARQLMSNLMLTAGVGVGISAKAPSSRARSLPEPPPDSNTHHRSLSRLQSCLHCRSVLQHTLFQYIGCACARACVCVWAEPRLQPSHSSCVWYLFIRICSLVRRLVCV